MGKSLKDIWFEEFLVSAIGSKVPMHCGLCGNSGIIKISGLVMPNRIELKPLEAFCICPNGRAYKRIDETNKKKNLVKK